MQIYGELIAPSDPKEWGECDGEKCGAWIEFNSMTGFNLRGHGTINGQGQNWWDPACNSQNTVNTFGFLANKVLLNPESAYISHGNQAHDYHIIS